MAPSEDGSEGGVVAMILGFTVLVDRCEVPKLSYSVLSADLGAGR